MQTITLEKLKELCDRYDDTWGNWPESRLEGESVFDFIKEQLDFERDSNEHL